MFTKKEERMMHDPYFEVIRETDNFVEVQSICTGHCWNVFKNTFEASKKITLYHKHNRKDKWYHEHRTCRTVSEAMDQIRQHDAYVLEQEKNAKERHGMPPHVRSLKVYSKLGNNSQVMPLIMLQGEWLRSCGFNPGDEIKVECFVEKMIITIEK